MAKEGIKVYNSSGSAGGAPGAAAPKRNAPILFKRDGFIGQQLRVEDIRMPEQPKPFEIDLKWLTDALSFLGTFKIFAQPAIKGVVVEAKAPLSSPPLFENSKNWFRQIGVMLNIPFLYGAELLTKTFNWLNIKGQALQERIVVQFVKTVNWIMTPVRVYILPPLNRFYKAVEAQVEKFFNFIEKKGQEFNNKIITPLLERIEKFIEKTKESLDKIAKKFERVKERIIESFEFALPAIEMVQQIPQQIATFSLWMANTPPAKAITATFKRFSQNISDKVQWLQEKAHKGAKAFKELLQKPLNALKESIDSVIGYTKSLIQRLLQWAMAQLHKLLLLIKRAWKMTLIGIKELPRLTLEALRLFVALFGRATLWLGFSR